MEYAIFRFEKMPMQNRYDEEGNPQVSTWDRAIRTRVPGMSPAETARQIQHLNRYTRALADKLKSVSPVLQRQIDAAQEYLSMHNNPDPINYSWVLVQLDHQLREIHSYGAAAGVNPSQRHRHHGLARRRSHSQTSGSRGTSYQRISLTAYFKRIPKPNVDITTLYEAKKRTTSFPQNHQAAHSQQQQPHHHQNPAHGPDPPTIPQGATSLGGGVSLGINGNRGSPSMATRPNNIGMQGDKPTNNGAVGNRGHGQGFTRKHGDFESDSDYSDYSPSDGSSFGSPMTPDTSRSSESFNYDKNRKHDQSNGRVPTRNISRRRDENGTGRGPSKGRQSFNAQDGSRMPPPPPPTASSFDINRVRDDAFLAGMRHGRGDMQHAQQRAFREAQRSRLNPRIVMGARSPQSPYPRRMASSEHDGPYHWGELDDEISRFNRLSLDDEEYGYDTVLRRADARRRREFEYHQQRGSVLNDDPFDDHNGHPHPRHRSRRYREPYISDGSDSDISLSPRGYKRFYY
ncbi:uncharacterized protein F4822DRAFT_384044 [Hypoxylon trugodes]|uniref:uncharacterized protein n=1 Tax=Hypoxylon trugodes TaxID=326681 RepID=UPI00218F58A3|nr:uncharacterized protein F4822DRAFT_384044 [Hypoxylon trugodes]KAI1393244.1 hypothetical protein F4822DRAFT_384044 [Hypoxylon trugodes]